MGLHLAADNTGPVHRTRGLATRLRHQVPGLKKLAHKGKHTKNKFFFSVPTTERGREQGKTICVHKYYMGKTPEPINKKKPFFHKRKIWTKKYEPLRRRGGG